MVRGGIHCYLVCCLFHLNLIYLKLVSSSPWYYRGTEDAELGVIEISLNCYCVISIGLTKGTVLYSLKKNKRVIQESVVYLLVMF